MGFDWVRDNNENILAITQSQFVCLDLRKEGMH